MNDITIVIPMAGKGSRFQRSEYNIPKPFIEFSGQMMIEHVLQGLAVPKAKYLLIIQKEFEVNQTQELKSIQDHFSVSYIVVDRVTQGAACTALAAHRKINFQQPVLFADSDNIFDARDIQAFVEDALVRQLDASLLTVPSDRSDFSYARLDERGLVCETREKQVISPHAIAGAYFFSRGSDFVDAAIDMIIYGEQQKKEYFMSHTFNILIAKNLLVGVYDIPIERFNCVGTPELLRNYLKK
ncbi:MAG: lipopolysaccharide biosynthesis protein [Candidatus Marinimicrobia bacterium]|nr:lipopolysaccharide biosynthesis protein [Candidatus Neomarinimicrobiota bacterium]|tara:strand:+ start:3124 stop:3849 length:726 start_codon:yes stop_codon:yes gene_type:complete